MAMLARMPLTEEEVPETEAPWRKLLRGLANNRPDIIAEMQPIRNRNELRRKMRDHLGAPADELRQRGWSLVETGPKVTSAMNGFIIKLGQALYYRHLEKIFEGRIYGRHYNGMHSEFSMELLTTILQMAAFDAEIRRGPHSLSDQFNYKFNFTPSLGILYAVVEFSPQFLLQILAVREDSLPRLLDAVQGLPQVFSVVEDIRLGVV